MCIALLPSVVQLQHEHKYFVEDPTGTGTPHLPTRGEIWSLIIRILVLDTIYLAYILKNISMTVVVLQQAGPITSTSNLQAQKTYVKMLQVAGLRSDLRSPWHQLLIICDLCTVHQQSKFNLI